MAQNNINLVGLDFEDIKQSLKTYLESQTQLKDYNFDGSVLNTILDVLAYNTHYQAFYTNMVANEMFLDSALLRPSVVSHAKQLGYTPSSIRASTAVVDIGLGNTASSDTFIARGTEFNGVNGAGTRYNFVNLETVFAESGANKFDSVSLYEGSIRRITYVYNKDTKIGSHLIIPNPNADMTTLQIRVYSSVSDNTGITDVWSLGTDYININSSSKVYFLQEKQAGIYEVYFGDGVLGQQPLTGNIVSIEYLETNGSAANGVVSFTKPNDAAITSIDFHFDTATGNTTTQSSGGSDLESVSRIKFTAPKFYQTANRAVTENDYNALVYTLFPNASSVRVYGGETITPPQYGKVFVALKPIAGDALTRSEKTSLEKLLRTKYSVVTITPEIVDPEYTDLIFDTTVVYDPTNIPVSVGIMKALVSAYIYGYSSAVLERFGSSFYYSKMANGIDGIHSSIMGVFTKLKLRKIVDVSNIIASKGWYFDFKNEIYRPENGYGSVLSSNIFQHLDQNGMLYTNAFLQDDGFGVINIVIKDPNDETAYRIVYPEVGSLEYDSGKVTLNSKFSPVVSTTTIFPLIVTVEPASSNINVSENQILRINKIYLDSVRVTMTAESNSISTTSIR